MSLHACPECDQHSTAITDVVTGAELLLALLERAARDDLEFVPEAPGGESLVYMVRCVECGWESLRNTERVRLLEDPEPIG